MMQNSARLTDAPEQLDIEFLEPCDAFAAFDEVERRGLRPKLTMLDPWYNKGFGGVVEGYDGFIENLLRRACRVSEHVFLWGFPEIIGPYVRSIPDTHALLCWLTWYYKNNPSVIRGWRSSQNACLHIAKPGAPLYPESFLSKTQKQKLADGTLRYMPGPTSVIESALLTGFVGRDEQTGHPAQKPVAVYDKLVRMVAKAGDLAFDPMCGSGTLGVVAKVRGLRAILSDRSREYAEMARSRVAKDFPGLADKLDAIGNNPDKAGARNDAGDGVAILDLGLGRADPPAPRRRRRKAAGSGSSLTVPLL
jgi:site-specific DNA-methyltransferase (adenine-specific)